MKTLLTIRNDPSLCLCTKLHQEITNKQYLMEDLTRLPEMKLMELKLVPKGHSFGASVFHVLRMCFGVRTLILTLGTRHPEVILSILCFF
jgi:hypothetical protein